MSGFLRFFHATDILYDRSVPNVAKQAARKAVEFAMLNLATESYSILAILADHSDTFGPLTREIPKVARFLCENEKKAPNGVDRFDKAGLNALEQELLQKIPYLPEEVDVMNPKQEDFEVLKSWVRQLESDGKDDWALDSRTGYSAMRLSAGLAGLLSFALRLDKDSEAEEIMIRITSRIHANQQSEYLSYIRQAWGKYFLSGWSRDRLGVTELELKEYATFIYQTTKKRLEEGRLKPEDVFKDKSFKEMLQELDENTMRFKDQYEEQFYQSDDEDSKDELDQGNEEQQSPDQQKYIAPSTIFRKPATEEQIAAAESKIGQSIPDDLKDFYTITNGTRPVISGPVVYCLSNRFPTVQSLYWEEEDWMVDYTFELLPGAKLPMSIDWPGIEGGGIAMYEHNGQGTMYVWYLEDELLTKAKKALDDAYQKANEADRKILDDLVKDYHGSWERLRNLEACWYEQCWGEPDAMIIFHDFRAFLSYVLFESMFEEDKSPLKLSEEKN